MYPSIDPAYARPVWFGEGRDLNGQYDVVSGYLSDNISLCGQQSKCSTCISSCKCY